MPGSKDVLTRKETIMQKALELFAEKGFHAATTKQIAERSGVAEGLIFYYFGGKRELLQQIIRRFSFFETAKQSESLLDELNGEEALRQYGRIYLSFLDSHQSFLLLLWSPELMHDDSVSGEVEKLLAGMSNQASRLLLRALEGVRPEPQSLETAATILLSSLMTYVLIRERTRSRSAEEDEAYISKVIDIVFHGLKNNP